MTSEEDINNEEKNNFNIFFGYKNPKLKYNINFPNNRVTTTKYTIITFLPKSLLFQFQKAANIYFLLVTILTFCSFSPINPGSMVGTFVFVLTCTMIKEAIEDFRRYQEDEINNNRPILKLVNGRWSKEKCWKLVPGDIVKILNEEVFSADTLMVYCSNETGYAYIETKSLDGESNLKEKMALSAFNNYNKNNIVNISGNIECELPNENLNEWTGKLYRDNDETGEGDFCSINNLLLKGCVLKNTKMIIGIVVYSGKNTKILKNAKKANQKTSKVLRTMNKILYSVFIVEISLCLIFGYLCLDFEESNYDRYSYIFIKKGNGRNINKFLINSLTYFVSYSSMIPISLYVMLEIIKIVQGILIYYDNDIYDYSIEKAAGCRSTDLIEELGQVEFIFSDKTGTLTQNSMILKKLYLIGKVFGNTQDDNINEHEKFSINGDMRLNKLLRNEDPESLEVRNKIEKFMYILCLCHSVFPDEKDGVISYQGASPDEISLVQGASQLGYTFKKKKFKTLEIQDEVHDCIKKFENKYTMPFDSDRKRMSVIIYDIENKKYELLSKGADTVMLELINFQIGAKEEITRVINVLSREGLRVLVMAHKELLKEQVDSFINKALELSKKGEKKELTKLYNDMEKNMIYSGTSAIEDKLQEGVSESIFTLLSCDIRIWVLTGDKQDTAEEIGKSCNLINENMFITYLINDGIPTEDKMKELQKEYELSEMFNPKDINLDEISRKIRKKQGKELSLIVDGETLENIFKEEYLSLLFFNLAIAAKSVICCRVNPKQKSSIVKLVKTYGNWTTLAIGDGANDVPMIMEAHVGVGIQGKEGTQAVRSADFSIGQFRYLQKLLLIYGRNGYIKISKFICYYFYKNIMLIFSDIIYAFYNGFSGQLYFPDYLTTMYNAIFTSWCCLFIFCFERDVNLNVVQKFPILYKAGQKNYFFNIATFWSYIIYAILHGTICYFIPELTLRNIYDKSGKTLNHWYKATVNFCLIIHVVSYKLLIISDFWNWVNLSAFVLSILLYYVIFIILCTDTFAFVLQNELAGVMIELFKMPLFWIIMIFGPFVATLIDITVKQIQYTGFPNPTQYLMQHINDDSFTNLLANEQTYSKMYQTPEAKDAERKIRKILKVSREQKKNKKNKKLNRRHLESSEINMENSNTNISSEIFKSTMFFNNEASKLFQLNNQ